MKDVYIHRRFFILGLFCVGLTGLLCGLLAGYGIGYHKGRESLIGGSVVSVDTVRDTVKASMPMAKDSIQTGVIRIPVIVPAYEPDEPVVPKASVKVWEPDSLFSEAQKRGKNRVSDTVWATIPRTQKRYEDSTYTAWVSGYRPLLDSIHVYRRTVTRTVVVSKKEKRNWRREQAGAGIIGGAGYGLTTKKPDVFVGVGGWIRIF